MNTYNSFNELAAGQQTMKTDMSVFNSVSDDTARSIADTLYVLRDEVERLFKCVLSEDSQTGEELADDIRKCLGECALSLYQGVGTG